MTEHSQPYEPEVRTHCLRYHAWAARVERSPSSKALLEVASLGTTDDQEIHACLHSDCAQRLGSKVLSGTLVIQDAGGIAACEHPRD